MATVTNTKDSQALRGQAAIVTVGASDIAAMQQFTVGETVTCDGGTTLGTIHSIDFYGNSFKVSPIQPNLTFTTAPGYLESGETVETYNP
jgi:hypothetical protein